MKKLDAFKQKMRKHPPINHHPPMAFGHGKMCNAKELHHRFRNFHRFFMIGPLVWLGLITYIVYKNLTTPGLTWDWHKVLMFILLFVFAKEIVSYTVSKRMYKHILKPVERLRDGMEEVAQGNYDYEVEGCGGPGIKSLIQSFNKMTQELKAAEELKSRYEQNRKELLANISHDLKTPITSINGYVDGIVDGVANSPEKMDRYMCIVQQNAKYMNRLIDDLILYSKLDVQKLDFHFKALDFRAYIKELYNEIQLEMEEKGHLLSLHIDFEESVMLQIDGQRMTRAIRNIVSNAHKYNEKANVQIAFELFKKDRRVQLCIRDNGPGIPKEKLDAIFDRFYRGDQARNSTVGGSGLGLAIAKEIVNAHGGQITAESQIDQGTTICIALDIHGHAV